MNSKNEGEVGFTKEAEGPQGLFAVFEDDGDTGYLYLYEPEGTGVFHDLHIYNTMNEPGIEENDIEVGWSTDLTTCTVWIRGKQRGTVDVPRSTANQG